MRNGTSAARISSFVRTVGIIFTATTLILCTAQAGLSADDRPALARSQPLEPADAAKTFQLKEGFTLQLTAAEPLVTDPVAGAFDEDGRLYVVEMNDYPYTDKSTDKPNVERTADLPIGKVRLLEDTDDDGVFDRSVIFARDLSWPTGVAVYNGGIFVAATPDLWYLKDEDGDGEADVRQKIFSGFRKLNVQAVANNLIWGLDHRIYGAGGTNGGTIVSGIHPSVPPVSISRNDFCFTPENPTFELLSGAARFGNTFDDWGNRFICNIRNPIQHIVLPLQAVNRNATLNAGSPVNDVAVAGDQIPVFRASPPEPWRIVNAARLSSQADPRMPRSEKNAQGFMTSACGVTIYRGDAYPPEFRHQVLLAEVAGNLIHRQAIEPTGVSFTSRRLDDASEFMTSTDNWFRPVNFLHAPDGTLYVLDMYRETIEHPWSMPDDLKAMLDLENGRDRGRIYRLTPPGWNRRRTPALSKASTAELVELLQHPNAWHRDTAHRLLFERQDPAAVTLLKNVLTDETSERGRLHAMWTLEGMNQLDESSLISSLKDSSAALREHAIRLAEKRASSTDAKDLRERILQQLVRLASDDAPRVRFQAALSLGTFDDPRCLDALAAVLRRDATDPWAVNAALSSSRTLAPIFLQQVLQEPEFIAESSHLALLKQLATVTGVRKDSSELLRIGQLISSLPDPTPDGSVTTELLLALEDGLRRGGSHLSEVWTDGDVQELLAHHLRSARTTVENPELSSAERLVALRLLTSAEPATVRAIATSLLSSQQPPEIQSAAVKALGELLDEQTAADLLNVFSTSTPGVQHEIIEAIASQSQRIPALFDAIQEGRLSAAQITPIRRTLLLNHGDEKIRERAKKLLAADRETPRRQVLEQFQDAATLTGDSLRGQQIFQRECSTCHRIGETGFDVGPGLITVKHRTAAELLTQILDPNREVGPSYMQFAVALTNGQVLAGIIAEESSGSVTLKQAQNRQEVILRENIEEIKATGLSLMPEGFEKKISIQEMADLIVFVRNAL